MTAPSLQIALTHVDLPNQSKGGVAHNVHHLANQLVSRGHQVTMFTFSPAFSECLYQVHQIESRGKTKKWSSYAFAWSLTQIDFSPYDILHSFGDNYLLKHRHPQVRTFMGSARDELQSATSIQRKLKQLSLIYLEKLGAGVADTCTGISLATQNRIPAVTKIVPPGVDLERFSPGTKSKSPSILFVGTLGGRKRGTFLAEVFAREIRPRFPDAQLWSVADAPLGGQGTVDSDAGIVDWGRVSLDELARLYRQAHVFCLPSTYEGFGIPYVEAMASGTAIVASPNAGALEITEAGKWGVVAPDAELGQTIVRLLGDPREREKWARLGLERAPLYRWEKVVAAYEAIYRETMAVCAARRGRKMPSPHQ